MPLLRVFLLFFLLSFSLFAKQQLQQEYLIKSKTIYLSDIVKSPKKDEILFNINPARYSKRVEASKLIQRLQSYGYTNFISKHTYIQFTQESPVNLKKLTTALNKYYKKNYNNISIQTISIRPTKYITQLPKIFIIGFQKHSYLAHKGIFYIKTPQNKKIFFNYNIQAKIPLCIARRKIEKAEEISLQNTEKKSIMLQRFRADPLMDCNTNRFEAKHRISKNMLITKRDITGLHLIKRGSNVTVTLKSGAVLITFSARALKSGRYGETITVLHDKNKKIRVRVTGKNRAEVE